MFSDGRPRDSGPEWQLGSRRCSDPSLRDRKERRPDVSACPEGPASVSLMRLPLTGDVAARPCVRTGLYFFFAEVEQVRR